MNEQRGSVEPRNSPYFGLDYYEEQFGAWFFGREAEGGKVITNLRAARLTLLHAESGVGKSSLLRAGVASRMRRLADDSFARRGNARSVPVVFGSWKDDPVSQLVGAIGMAIKPYLAGHQEPDLCPDRLDNAIETASSAVNANLYFMLDQFEEYFLYCGQEPTPERFADQLAACINRADLRANFLIAIREDAYAGLGDLFKGRIANVYGNYLHVEYLDHQCAETAIRGPLDIYNSQPGIPEPVGIQDELVEAVLDQVRAYDGSGEPDLDGASAGNGSVARVSTPLLQLVMESVWQHERAGGSHVLRLSTLQNLHGVRMIVDTHLGNALGQLGNSGRQTAIDLFDHLVTPSGGKIAESVPDLAKRTGHTEDQVGSVLTRLDDARIVRPVPAPPGQDPMRFRRYEIFHDVLAPAINREIAAREEQHRVRRVRRLAALAVALLLVTLAVVGVFFVLWNNAANEKLMAESRNYAALADVNATENPELAVLLALRALHLSHTSQAEDSLRVALPELQEMRTVQETTTVLSAVFDPADANKVASADRNGVASMWDVTTGRRLFSMSLGGFGVTGGATSVAVNPHGTEVAVGYASGQVALFNAKDGKKLRTASIHGSPSVNGMEFLGNTNYLAIATQKGLAIWLSTNRSPGCCLLSREDVSTVAVHPGNPTELAVTTAGGTVVISGRSLKEQRLPRTPWFANDAEFSPDGSEVVTAGSDGKVRVYDLAKRKTVMTLDAGEVDATSAEFSPDGKEIVAGYSSGLARVWSTTTRLQLTQLAGDPANIDSVRFSANGSEVVTASDDGTIRIWHAQPREMGHVFAEANSGGQPNAVDGVGYLPDGRVIALSSSGQLGVFTASGAEQADIQPPGTTALGGAAWNRAGTELATADGDGTVDVWQAAGSGYNRIHLPSPIREPGGIAQIAMSPNGALIAIVPADNYYAVQVRSAHTGRLVRTLNARNSLSALTFSPTGSQILAGDYHGQAEAWPTVGGRPRVLGKPGPEISDLEFNKNGSEFVTASAGGTVTVWDGRDDRPLRTIPACRSLTTASPNPTGSEIVVACGDGTARVLDAVTGQQLTVLPATTAGIVSGAGFSPDGKSIVTAIDDAVGTGGIEVWNSELANPSISKIQQIAEQRITHQLTPAERTYLARASG